MLTYNIDWLLPPPTACIFSSINEPFPVPLKEITFAEAVVGAVIKKL